MYHRLISMPSEHVMPLGFQPLGLGRELRSFWRRPHMMQKDNKKGINSHFFCLISTSWQNHVNSWGLDRFGLAFHWLYHIETIWNHTMCELHCNPRGSIIAERQCSSQRSELPGPKLPQDISGFTESSQDNPERSAAEKKQTCANHQTESYSQDQKIHGGVPFVVTENSQIAWFIIIQNMFAA